VLNVDARSKSLCPICDLSDKSTPLVQGKYVCDSHSKMPLQTAQFPDNHRQAHKATAPITNSAGHAMVKLLILLERFAPQMPDGVDVYEVIDAMPYKDALRYLKTCHRWLTEMRMEYKGGPEARSFNSILSESRLFPNSRG